MKDDLIPFLTWAGGKRWLVTKHPELFPLEFNTYLEPFLGSGAVFFALNPERAILNDLNAELINTYETIKNDYLRVENYLNIHHKRHSKEYYYKIRNSRTRTPYTKAAKFIYLNRTCFNGLYRVNKLGQFNVPIGSKKNVILETDNFKLVSKVLQNVEFSVSDFETIVNRANPDDFLFIDPPYTINHNENGFIKYNEKIFSWQDQERLAKSLVRARDRGVKILATNANHESVKSLYLDLDFNCTVLKRFSGIASDGSKRAKYEELIIKANY
ncbi:DNA adenine methylase [Sporosarcina contaminans]|uniref:site-specific DNA-methyltransferase (adenine-specific) n=1 Tax=Sporosarcina contaminans TaxID=633403 RepID=A0ABW3TTQ1_9BACL